LSYNFFRSYQAREGRYTQADPIGVRGGINSFTYANGSPQRLVDADGLKARMCCIKIPSAFVPAVHCFVEEEYSDMEDLHCGNIDYCVGRKRRVGLHGPYPYGNSSYDGAGQIRIDDAFDDVGKSKCGQWNKDCGVHDCIDNVISNYPNPSVYRILGPNSNTFAKVVATSCGMEKPTTLFPAVGWGSDPPGQSPSYPYQAP